MESYDCVRPLASGDYVRISVTDTGVDMTRDVQRRGFEPFFTTKDVGKGTGLGLAQIYGFAKQSGGTATIESALGKGTTVALYLPRVDREIVEDQPDVLEVIEVFLEGLDYRILTAADGVAARKLLESNEPIDLLLTDAVMPNGVSGMDLAHEARRLRQDLKIVMMSGYLRDPHSRADALPDLVFLEKPFRQTELAHAITGALSSIG